MIPLRDNIPSRTVPVVNYILITANVLVFLFEVSLPERGLRLLLNDFALVPRRIVSPRHWEGPLPDVLPFVTSMFLHGGWMHLIGNMLFLYIFGDNVEDRLGHARYLLFYLGFGIAASIVHILFGPLSPVPTVGASGAIAGVMGAYLVLYPRARILVLVPIFYLAHLVEVPAPFFLPIWFLLDLLKGTLSLVHPDVAQGVAVWAHVGGFAAGSATAFLLFREPVRRPRRRREEEEDDWSAG